MTSPSEPGEAGATARQELDRLNGQVAVMRAVLVQLLQDVVRTERQLDSSLAAQLLEANEQLVVNALGARAEAESATGALDEAAWSGEHDLLTGLPNRALLMDRLGQAIANAKRHGNRAALLFLDLDNFKQINDTFGHATGDQALQLVADCMRSLVRETDTVSRHGGDEFLIVLAEIAQAADASIIAEKVNAALRGCNRIGDHAVSLAASIGISIYPEDGEDAKTLIDRADAAMYWAKKYQFGGFAFHADQPADQPALPAPALQSQQRRLTHHELTVAEHERRHALLQEANEQLVLAALGAQELQAAAEEARRGRSGSLDTVAQQQRKIVDIGAMVLAASKSYRSAIERRRQSMEVHVPSAPIGVLGNSAQIQQVLTNLLDNATTYTSNGGAICLSVEPANETVVITVSDNGMGIASDALTSILDPFVRDARARAVNRDGLGLGLTVVRSTVESHGGSVAVTSAGLGRGSRFVVALPAAPFQSVPQDVPT